MACMFFVCNLISNVLTANPLYDTSDLKTCVKRCQALTDSMKEIVSSYEVNKDIKHFKELYTNRVYYAPIEFVNDAILLKQQTGKFVQSSTSVERKLSMSEKMDEFEVKLNEFMTILNSTDTLYVDFSAINMGFEGIQFRLIGIHSLLQLYQSIDRRTESCKDTMNDPYIIDKRDSLSGFFEGQAENMNNCCLRWIEYIKEKKSKFIDVAQNFVDELSSKMNDLEMREDQSADDKKYNLLCDNLVSTLRLSISVYLDFAQLSKDSTDEAFAMKLSSTLRQLFSYDFVCVELFAKASAEYFSETNISNRAYDSTNENNQKHVELRKTVEHYLEKVDTALIIFNEIAEYIKETKGDSTVSIPDFEQEKQSIREKYESLFLMIPRATNLAIPSTLSNEDVPFYDISGTGCSDFECISYFQHQYLTE